MQIPILSSILDFALPKKCICGEKFCEVQGSICDECFIDIKFSSDQNCCKICSFPFECELGSNSLCSECIDEEPVFRHLKYVFAYNDFTGGIIKNFKYADATYLTNSLVNLLYSKAKLFDDIDVICSVPITPKKLRARKYNQAAILAKQLAPKIFSDCDNMLLTKNRETRVQAGLNKKERQKNLKNSFSVSAKTAQKYKGKNILIIDDVYTTGTTMNECAKTILSNIEGANVYGIAIARVFKD